VETLASRVLVAGSINMDIVAKVQRHPVPGETISGTDLAYFPGGKGANQAVAAARAGATVLMLGAVGDDAFAEELVSFLEKNNVSTDGVVCRSNTPTGTALIIVDAAAENEIVVVPGANGTVDATVVGGSRPNKGDVLVAQYETPISSTLAFFDSGRRVGATCVLNPAPAATVSDDLLDHVDILVVNETELSLVAAVDVGSQAGTAEIRAAAERLRERGFHGALVATLGARGSVTVVGNRTIEVEGRRVEAIDTTGGGDCFTGYLASGLSEGRDIETALRIANDAASLCVQRAGAGPSMPLKAEVDALRRGDVT
jgi:ribokinase